MITDPDRFKHSASSYDRPTDKFRCGRERRWEHPCHQGPNPDGSCGGTSECQPTKNTSGGFDCKRPQSAGGPCKDGPIPDGTCSQKHPACVPHLSVRAKREQLATLFIGFVFTTLLGLFALSRVTSGAISPIDPGPLSQKHANFAKEQGCVACHGVHHEGTGGWLKAFFTKSDLSNQCMSCHVFGGPELNAHNTFFADRPDLKDTSCMMCHTEHKGRNFNIRTMEAGQCNSCHVQKFKSFSEDHPPFSDQFPHGDRTAIQFDHAAHFDRHFLQASVKAHAPESCLACHNVKNRTDRYVTTQGFDAACASCHTKDILKADLILFRSPELLTNTISPGAVAQACGPGSGYPEKGAFESISFEEPATIASYLVGVDPDDPDEYGPFIQQLMLAMGNRDVDAISGLIDQRLEREGASENLLAGLESYIVKNAACAWLANQEVASSESPKSGGWYADLTDLRYKPKGHADHVAKSWVDFGASAALDQRGTEGDDRAEALRKHLLTGKNSVGRCTKCHSVSLNKFDDGTQKVFTEWTYREPEVRNFTFYSHGAHIDLLGGGAEACMTCHVTNPEADFASSFDTFEGVGFVSNFKAIKKETCMQCHGAGQSGVGKGEVRQDCLLCHTYHVKPSLKGSMLKRMGAKT